MSPVFLDVFLTVSGLKYALSRSMFVVPSLTSVSAPPMTPASATGFSPSQIRRSSAESFLSTPSKVVMVSPSSACLTTIFCPFTRS